MLKPCSQIVNELSAITINLGQTSLVIPPEGYVLDDTLGYKCLVAIGNGGSAQGPYVLGDTFMRNFYTTFDYGSKRIELAVSANAPTGVEIKHHYTLKRILLVSFASLLVVLVLACICKRVWDCRKRSMRSRGVVIGSTRKQEAQSSMDYNVVDTEQLNPK